MVDNVNVAVSAGLLVRSRRWPLALPEPPTTPHREPQPSASPTSSPTSTKTTTLTPDASGSKEQAVSIKPDAMQNIVKSHMIADKLCVCVCCRCRVPGTYYFVYHASLDDKLCVLMKMDDQLLTAFCDHRRIRRQVPAICIITQISLRVIQIFSL